MIKITKKNSWLTIWGNVFKSFRYQVYKIQRHRNCIPHKLVFIRWGQHRKRELKLEDVSLPTGVKPWVWLGVQTTLRASSRQRRQVLIGRSEYWGFYCKQMTWGLFWILEFFSERGKGNSLDFVKPIPVSLETELQGLRLGVGGSNLGAVLLTQVMLFSTIALHLCEGGKKQNPHQRAPFCSRRWSKLRAPLARAQRLKTEMFRPQWDIRATSLLLKTWESSQNGV